MKSFLVIGLGAFGAAVAKSLFSMGFTVVGVDNRRERVEEMRDLATEVVEANAADLDVLEGLDVASYDAVVVGVGRRLDASILICLFLMELKAKRIVAKVLTDEHRRVLLRLGVREIIFPEADSGNRLGHNLSGTNVVDLLPLGNGVGVMEVPAPASFAGKSLETLKVRKKHGLLVIAIRKAGDEEVDMQVGGETVISAGDGLILLGPEEAVASLPE